MIISRSVNASIKKAQALATEINNTVVTINGEEMGIGGYYSPVIYIMSINESVTYGYSSEDIDDYFYP